MLGVILVNGCVCYGNGMDTANYKLTDEGQEQFAGCASERTRFCPIKRARYGREYYIVLLLYESGSSGKPPAITNQQTTTGSSDAESFPGRASLRI